MKGLAISSGRLPAPTERTARKLKRVPSLYDKSVTILSGLVFIVMVNVLSFSHPQVHRMSKSPIRYLLLGAVLVCLAGCTNSDKIYKEVPGFENERLASVVLISGEEIRFGPRGGHYERGVTIAGTSPSGDRVEISYDLVEEARAVAPRAFKAGEWKEKPVTEVLRRDSTIVRFDGNGGKYDSATGSLEGRKKDSRQTLSIKDGDILEARGSWPTIIPLDAITRDTTVRVAELILNRPQARLVTFDRSGGRAGQFSDWVVGWTSQRDYVRVQLADVLYARVERFDVAKTIFSVIGVAAVTVLVAAIIIAATKQSCPFVYSFDGSQYQFDAEPLGGATTEGLARTDYSRLEHLAPSDGSYRLLMRNEADETQYVDAISICAVDHDSSLMPIAAGAGMFHLLPASTSPVSVTDARGSDLLRFFSHQDGIAWQTHLESGSYMDSLHVRDTLTFRFLKPGSARRAQLVIHGGTTLWGSNMIRVMYTLLGRDVDRWYDEVDRKGPEYYRLLNYFDREQLYSLGVYVHKNRTWVDRGSIIGGGPLLHEQQVIPVSVAGITGDTLEVRIHPPLGFWSLDYVGVVYDADSIVTATDLPLATALDEYHNDISKALRTVDRSYYEMPTAQNEATLTFVAPPFRPGLARSLFLRTSGYYKLHLDKNQEPQTDLLSQLNATPGAIVRYSTQRYMEWHAARLAELRSGSGHKEENGEPQ